MTYQIGNIITATDTNTFLTSVRNLYGVGNTDRGYGQTAYALTALTAGEKITSAQLSDFRDALEVLTLSQTGTTPAGLPPSGVFDAGDLIEAHESDAPTSDAYDLDTVISDADTNRLTAFSLSTGSVSGTSIDTRVGTWGSSSGGIELVFDVTWPTTDEARYFFNSGGQIRIALSHPTGTSQDNDWNTSLSTRVGQIRFGAHSTVMQGSLGFSAALGYYEMSSSIQTIYSDLVVGSSPYGANTLRLQYIAIGSAANGGPGNGIRFTIRLTDGHTSAFSDSVSAGTAATFSYAKNSYLSSPTITTPTGAVNSAWTVV